MGLKTTINPRGALWFGTGFHIAFAEWYIPGTERGRDPRETWEEYCVDAVNVMVRTSHADELEKEYMDAKDLGNIMLKHYLDTYGDEPNIEILAPEQTFSVLIEDPEFEGIAIVNHVGTFDAVYRNRRTGKIWLFEHKTASQFPDLRFLELDDQAGGYLTVAETALQSTGMIEKNERIEGILYNYLRKGKPHDKPRDAEGRYLNKDGSVSKVQPPDTLKRQPIYRTSAQREIIKRRIQTEAIQMEPYRSNFDALTKTPTKDCTWDCDFFELCQVQEAGGDTDDFIKNVMVVEDPYMDHRLGAKNSKESVALMRETKRRG